MQVWMVGILVTIDEIWLVFHPKALHIAVGYGGEFSIGELFGGLKIERGVQHFKLGTGIQFDESLEPFELFTVSDGVLVLQKIVHVNEFCLAVCYFFLIVGKDPGQVRCWVYSRNHN